MSQDRMVSVYRCPGCGFELVRCSRGMVSCPHCSDGMRYVKGLAFRRRGEEWELRYVQWPDGRKDRAPGL